MPDLLPENLPKVGGVHNIQDLIPNPFFSDQFSSSHYEPISHADIVLLFILIFFHLLPYI